MLKYKEVITSCKLFIIRKFETYFSTHQDNFSRNILPATLNSCLPFVIQSDEKMGDRIELFSIS